MNTSPTVRYWTRKIEKSRKALDGFLKEAEKAEKAARDEDSEGSFNVHWANTKITRSAIYGRVPKPDVRRRFQRPDRDEKELARLVERSIEYHVDSGTFDCESQAVVKDYVDVGLGWPRVYYDVQTDINPEFGTPEIVSQSVGIEHIPWRYLSWEPGKPWHKIDWIAIESYMPRSQAKEEFGVEIKSGKDRDDYKRKSEKAADEVQLYEIWYRPTRKVYVICPQHDEPLEERDDTLNLSGFFPGPRPAFANLKSDELIPKPDYSLVENQIVEINGLAERITKLSKQIRDLSMCDDSISSELRSLMEHEDGDIMPAHDLIARLAAAGGGDISQAIYHLPMAEKAATVRELNNHLDEKKNQLYEIIGLSDIVRGATKAQETAAAQQIKGQWANIRLSEKTYEVARLWREVYRIFAEIICEHFTPEQLEMQTGIAVTPRMQEIMTSDIGRSFAIDIETDSTIQKDDMEERAQTLELVNILLEKASQMAPAVANNLLTAEFVQETMLMIVSRHKHGKQLEDAIQGLTEHYKAMPDMMQQLQMLQQQLVQMQQQLQGQMQANQQLQGQLAQVNQRKEDREDARVQLDAGDKGADNRREDSVAVADINLKQAQAMKAMRDAQTIQ